MGGTAANAQQVLLQQLQSTGWAIFEQIMHHISGESQAKGRHFTRFAGEASVMDGQGTIVRRSV